MSDIPASSPAGEPLGPRDPWVARVPFFYGWAMLPIAMVAMVATLPGQTQGVAVVNRQIAESLQLTPTQLATSYGLGTLLACLTLPFFGAMMDRHGIRSTMLCVVVLFGASCVFTSQIHGAGSLFLAFFLLRMLGQGALAMLASNTVSMWFNDRLGAAMGIMNFFCVLIMGHLPGLIRPMSESLGWRSTYMILGVCVWCTLLPIILVWFRNRPEDVGQWPDGRNHAVARPQTGVAGPWVASMDMGEAMRTRSYWILAAIHLLWGLIGTALVFDVQGIFESRGFARPDSDRALAVLFTSVAVTQFLGGLLADRVRLNLLLAFGLIGMAGGVALMLASSWGLMCGYAVFGLAQGFVGAAATTLWSRYFGVAHLGKIRGSIFTAVIAGSAVGPYLLGLAYSYSGSYQLSIGVFALTFVPLSAVALFATPPRGRSPASTLRDHDQVTAATG